MRPLVTRTSISGPPPLSCDSSVRIRLPDASSEVASPLTVIPPFTERAFSVAFAVFGISSEIRPFVLSSRTGPVTCDIFADTWALTAAASIVPLIDVSSMPPLTTIAFTCPRKPSALSVPLLPVISSRASAGIATL